MSALEFCDIALQVCAGCFFLVIAAMLNDLVSPLFFPAVVEAGINQNEWQSLSHGLKADNDDRLDVLSYVNIQGSKKARLMQNLPVQGMNLDDSLDVGQVVHGMVRLEDMSVKELYALCREHSIKKYSRKSKAQLIKELSNLI